MLFRKPRKFTLIGFVLVFCGSTLAAPVPPARSTSSTIDQLQAQLYKTHKSKSASLVKKAHVAMLAHRFTDVKSAATLLLADSKYSDYGNWFMASALREEGRNQSLAKNFAGAQKTIEKSITSTLRLEADHPYSPFLKDLPRDLAQSEFLMGYIYLNLKQWKNCQDSLEKAFYRMATHSSLSLIPVSGLINYAQACAKQDTESCALWFQRFVRAYSSDSDEVDAMKKYYSPKVERTVVNHSFPKATQSYKAPDLDQAAFDEAMKSYADSNYGEAITAFNKFLDDYPKSGHRFRVRYWLGQSYAQKKDPENSKKILESLRHDSPLTFYGLMASIGSGQEIDDEVSDELPTAVSRDPNLTPLEAIRLRRGEELLAEGDPEFAGAELKEVKSRDPFSNSFLIYLSMLDSEAGSYVTSFQILQDLLARGSTAPISNYGLKMLFPMVFNKAIQRIATDQGLDPIFVLALIKQESAFDPKALSSSGAMGLMQLMPATAQETQSNLDKTRLTEPEMNILVGTKYLKGLLKKYNGNLALATAAYNAGPRAVDRWLKEPRAKKGVLEFIESIPYRETREYVASIIRNYYWYSKKLKNGLPASVDFFWTKPSEIKPQNGSA